MIATALVTLWASLYTPIMDGDVWFHMLYGKQIIENQKLIVDHTLYSWTPSSNSHLYCAWFGEVIYYLVYQVLGLPGIILIRYITSSVLLITILHLSRQRDTFYNPVTWFAATLCVLVMSQAALDKPEAFSTAFMALAVWNWYEIKLLKKYATYRVYLFPLIILVWVNTHGIFIFGCLFLLSVGIGETLNQVFYRKNALPKKIYGHMSFAFILALGSIFVTPYGYAYIKQLVTQSFDQQLQEDLSNIPAYTNTFELQNNTQLIVFANIAIILLGVILVLTWHRKKLDFVPVISNLLFACFYTFWARTTFLWVPVFALTVTYYCSVINITGINRKKTYYGITFMATFLLSGWLLYYEHKYPPKDRWGDFGLSTTFTIEEELDFIQKNYPDAVLGNMHNHGEYILWKTWPQKKVMIDARYFPYKEWANEYFLFDKGINVEGFIQKYPFDVIEIRHVSYELVKWFSNSTEWKCVFYGKSAVVFVRTHLALHDKPALASGVRDIREYPVGVNILQTALQIKDWNGAEQLLSFMKQNMTSQEYKQKIDGLQYVKQGRYAYNLKDYSSTIQSIEQARTCGINSPTYYSAASMMLALQNWHTRQYETAVKQMITSLFAYDTFAATYNLAMMAWQVENMQKNNGLSGLSFSDKEKEILSAWRKALKQLIDKNKSTPQQTNSFLMNAQCMLDGREDCQKTFLMPNWL
jgi:hypothetical protein